MNKFFQSAISRYKQLSDKEFLINPISEKDCEIITELLQIIKKAGLDDVISIMKSFKEFKDDEIRDNLLQWNIDNPSLNKEEHNDLSLAGELKKVRKKPDFVKINNLIIHEFDLRGISLFEELSDNKEEMIYGIILNPTPDGFNLKSVPYFANEKIKFNDEENRKEVLDKLSEFLSNKGINIINLGNE